MVRRKNDGCSLLVHSRREWPVDMTDDASIRQGKEVKSTAPQTEVGHLAYIARSHAISSLFAASIAIPPLHSIARSTGTTKCRQDEPHTMPSGLKRLWWRWKSLRLPWRKKWFVGMFSDCCDAPRSCLFYILFTLMVINRL